MTISDSPTVLTVRSTEDVLAMAPIALGFHPDDSLVLLTFARAKNMPAGLPTGDLSGGFHARIDMPRRRSDVAAVVEPLRLAVRRHGARLGAVVLYSDDVDLGRRTGSAAATAFLDEGLDLIEVVQVHDGQWWEIPVGRAPRHWRPERHEVDVSCHPILAERIFDGHVILGSRDDLADSIRGGDEIDQRRIATAVDAVTDRWCADPDLAPPGQPFEGDDGGPADFIAQLTDAEAAWLQAVLARPSSPLPADDVARILLLAQVEPVRDRVCSALSREIAHAQLPVWREVVRRAPPHLVSGAAAVLALVAWLAGDGALAWCAIDRCYEVEPHHRLAAHVATALQNAVPPSAWESGRTAS